MRRKKVEPRYQITLKGLIRSTVLNELLADQIWDAIELYSFRTKHNAVLIKDGGTFVNVVEETK